jgi:phosphate butyryltransferase
MESISSFAELIAHLKLLNNRKRIAVANAVDSHTLEAVLRLQIAVSWKPS